MPSSRFVGRWVHLTPGSQGPVSLRPARNPPAAAIAMTMTPPSAAITNTLLLVLPTGGDGVATGCSSGIGSASSRVGVAGAAMGGGIS